jgi:hypothetical protein
MRQLFISIEWTSVWIGRTKMARASPSKTLMLNSPSPGRNHAQHESDRQWPPKGKTQWWRRREAARWRARSLERAAIEPSLGGALRRSSVLTLMTNTDGWWPTMRTRLLLIAHQRK